MSRAELNDALRRLPAILSGHEPDTLGIASGFKARLGMALLTEIKLDFITKSRGGIGRDGIKWPPLKRSTIAQRRTSRAEKKELGIGGRRVRGLLTPSQDRRWRQIYGTRLARLRMTLDENEARARAAQIAWAVLKSEGAKTKLEVLGGRQVDILRDTGELLRSISPGVNTKPDGQILLTEIPGKIVVGTNKKPWHHRGVPGRLPARPLWPLSGDIPDAWWEGINRAAERGIAQAARMLAGDI